MTFRCTWTEAEEHLINLRSVWVLATVAFQVDSYGEVHDSKLMALVAENDEESIVLPVPALLMDIEQKVMQKLDLKYSPWCP